MEKNEPVTITYKNDKITMKGKSFTATLSISGSELTKVYWGNEGKGTVKMVLEDSVPEKKPETKPVETPVQPTTSSVKKTSANKLKTTSSNEDFMRSFKGG